MNDIYDLSNIEIVGFLFHLLRNSEDVKHDD